MLLLVNAAPRPASYREMRDDFSAPRPTTTHPAQALGGGLWCWGAAGLVVCVRCRCVGVESTVSGRPTGRPRFSQGKGSVVGVVDGAPVGLRVAKDGTATRVPLALDEYGSPVGMLCEQIGCQLVQLVTLAGGLELWLDEEALVFLDVDDRAAVAAAVNPVATMIASRTAPLRQPVFGVAVFLGGDGESSAGLSAEQLDELERLVALSAETMARSESMVAHAGGDR